MAKSVSAVPFGVPEPPPLSLPEKGTERGKRMSHSDRLAVGTWVRWHFLAGFGNSPKRVPLHLFGVNCLADGSER